MSSSRNEAFARAAHLFGRLSHVFADREAILERNSLTEDAFRAMEARTIEALLGASQEELAHFARAFAESRAALLNIKTATARESTTATASAPANTEPVRPVARTLRQAPYDPAAVDDLMETLHSPPNTEPERRG